MVFSSSTPIPWRQVLARTVSEIGDDDCFGLAAQLSFYFLLSLFPALLFLVALLGYVPLQSTFGDVLGALATIAPHELVTLVRGQLAQIANGSQTSLLTVGVVGAIWSSSAAMVAIIDALNRAFDVAEWRPWWKRRLVAIVLTIALALFIILSVLLILIGPAIAFRAAEWLGLEPAVAMLWTVLRWPVMVGCAVLGINLVYYFAPNRNARWAWITPGSVLATGLWLAGSFAFKLYVTNIGDYTATYGAIGGAIVTMLWFYLSSFAILIGAELNGVIDETGQPARSSEQRRGQ